VCLQRLSVICTDVVLYGAAWFGTRRYKEPQRSIVFLLLIANAGLLIVDHIHFQYNGFLMGEHGTPGLKLREGLQQHPICSAFRRMVRSIVLEHIIVLL
jgi:hypothetical protein